MKKLAAFLMATNMCLCAFAQQSLGVWNSNYAGIQGALLNPSSIAGSKLKWDVNILSGDMVFDNTFLYAPKQELKFFGINNLIQGSLQETLYGTHYNPQDPGKLYNVTFSTQILGPSFFMKVAKKHEVGFTLA